MYVTPVHLADGPDACKELAELYGIAPALLAAVIAGGDTSMYPPNEVAAANDAHASIARYCGQADGEVDARLARRGYALPIDTARFPVVVVWARSIALYRVHRTRDRTSEQTGRIERDYRDAERALALVADGTLTLGANDPMTTANAGTGAAHVNSRPRLFSRSTLGEL